MHSKFGCTIMLIPYFCISVGYHGYSLHNSLCIRKVNIMVILTKKNHCVCKHYKGVLLRFCILQAIKNWNQGRPGNEASFA